MHPCAVRIRNDGHQNPIHVNKININIRNSNAGQQPLKAPCISLLDIIEHIF
jgi:hypothetical protein